MRAILFGHEVEMTVDEFLQFVDKTKKLEKSDDYIEPQVNINFNLNVFDSDGSFDVNNLEMLKKELLDQLKMFGFDV